MRWTDESYNEALHASNGLVKHAMRLNDALGAGGGSTSPEDVMEIVRAVLICANQVNQAAAGIKKTSHLE